MHERRAHEGEQLRATLCLSAFHESITSICAPRATKDWFTAPGSRPLHACSHRAHALLTHDTQLVARVLLQRLDETRLGLAQQPAGCRQHAQVAVAQRDPLRCHHMMWLDGACRQRTVLQCHHACADGQLTKGRACCDDAVTLCIAAVAAMPSICASHDT